MLTSEFIQANLTQTFTSDPKFTLTTDALESARIQAEQATHGEQNSFSDLITDRVVSLGGVMQDLEQWETERKSWETTELAASHARLYGILTKCYAFYTALKSEETGISSRKLMRDGLERFISDRGFKTLAKTHDMNRVVKAVFGEDRRRASAYASALRVALISGDKTKNGDPRPVKPDNLSAWLMQQGGIEEVRTASANSGITSQERVATAKAAVQAQPLMVFKPDSKTMQFDSDDADRMLVLVVTYRPSGDLEVNTVVKGNAALTAALSAHYAANKGDMAKVKAAASPEPKSAVSLALGKTV